jgi:GTP-binding protein HflX
MDLYEEKTFDAWLEEPVKKELLEELRERWGRETEGNAVFVSATEKENLEELRARILGKVKEMYKERYPYRTEYIY